MHGSVNQPISTASYQKASRAAAIGDFDRSRQLYERLLDAESDSPYRARLLNDLATLDVLEGRTAVARERFSAAIAEDDDCGIARENLNRLERFERVPLSGGLTNAGAPAAGMNRVRVAILSLLFNWPSTGGGTVHTTETAKFLSQAGYDVRHISARFPEWELGMIREPSPFPVTSIEFSREEWNAPTIQRRFREEVDRFSPDFVIITDSWNFKPLLADAMQGYRYLLRLAAQECLCPLNNIRLLIDAEGRPSACPKNQLATADACRQCVADNDHYSGSLHRAERELAGFSDANYEESLRRAFSRAEAVLVVNPLIAATVSAYTKDVRVIPSGFDPDRFPPPDVELPETIPRDEKRSDGESATPTVILFAGLCDEYIKGFHVLREALSIVWQRRQDFELRVTADPPPTPLPFARYVGWQSQDNLPALMRSVDMIVFPTVVEEALGRTAVEAMGAGKPVVASQIGGLPFTVLDEATGLLFEPGNAADLAAKIERLLNDAELRTRLGAAGRRRFETSYSWPVIIKRCYEPLLGVPLQPRRPQQRSTPERS